MSKRIPLYNRTTGQREAEIVYEQWFMDFCYGTFVGRVLTRAFLRRRFFSRLYGVLQRRPTTPERLERFARLHGIDLQEIAQPLSSYPTFNDFFIRLLVAGARPIDPTPGHLIAPCDGRLLHLPVDAGTLVPVKGRSFSVAELVADSTLAAQYAHGDCLVYRLAPADYHRFNYLDDGRHDGHRTIEGRLDSVSPYALEVGVRSLVTNHRELCVLNTAHFGRVVEVEVGAMVVGRILQHHPTGARFSRGEEKGYFALGGSTIVLLFEQGRIRMDDDIRAWSQKGVETRVRLGTRVGTRI